jgi:tRNA pseudouridine55 synthase
MEGNVTKTAPCNHVTWKMVKDVLPRFQGSISQIPPIFSAIRKNGKKLYKAARQGVSADDLDIEPRTVEIYRIELLKPPPQHDVATTENHDDDGAILDPPKFDIEVECGGGTYIRSLVRDIGYALDTVATTTRLKRTKQGRFLLSDCLAQDDWSADNIFEAIDQMNERLVEEDVVDA